jgi:hypothetical protein
MISNKDAHPTAKPVRDKKCFQYRLQSYVRLRRKQKADSNHKKTITTTTSSSSTYYNGIIIINNITKKTTTTQYSHGRLKMLQQKRPRWLAFL